LKILNLCYTDMAGAAFTLSHAINKYTKHQAISLRGQNNYLSYPAFAEMQDYNVDLCRKMVYNSDVIVFHTVVLPYLEGLGIDHERLKGKKLLVYFHGTEFRQIGDQLIEQAQMLLGNPQFLVSTPDMMALQKDVKWLPVCRSFSEISRRYGLCNQDRKALDAFVVPKGKVVFTHAPTSEEKKGSAMFYRAITKVIKELSYVSFLTIRNQPWFECLQHLRNVDVLFDCNPPFPFAYGAVSVEASIFKSAIVTKIDNDTIRRIKELTGLKSPFITFSDEADLTNKAFRLAEDPELRRIFGGMAYKYCKAVHDEKPVAKRFMNILESMD